MAASKGGYVCDIYGYEIRKEHPRWIPDDKKLEFEEAGFKGYSEMLEFHNITMPLLDYDLD